ncbi:MAG: hypothetical protein SNJ57_14740, partial [Cyanobacteriota bacterium]
MSQSSSRQNLTFNQQSYLRLKLALSLNLRRQVFIAVCDDLPLRDRLASQLQADFSNPSPIHQGDRAFWEVGERRYPRLVTLDLNLSDPNPIVQVAQWLADSPPPMNGRRRSPVPAFQFLGIEQLTRQSPTTQRMFITHLQGIERSLPVLDSSLLFWMPQPWFRLLPQSALEFWRCRTGVFEFVGEPTPRPPKTMTPIVSTAPTSRRVPNTLPNSSTASTPPARAVSQPTPPKSTPASQMPARAEAARNIETQVAKAPESTPPDHVGTSSPANPWAIAPAAPPAPPATPTAGSSGTTHPASPTKPPASPSVPPTTIAQSPAPPPASTAPTPLSAAAKPSPNPVSGSFRLDAAQTPAPSSVAVGRATATSAVAGKSPTPAAASSASPPPPAPPKPPLVNLSSPADSESQITQLLEQIAHLHQQSASAAQLQDAYRMLGDAYRDRIEQGDTSLPTLM